MTPIWSIVQLDVTPEANGNPNVVTTVHWECVGTDGTATGRVYSSCSVPAPTDTFVSYDQLTREMVLDWIWAHGVDRAATEAAVATQIDAIRHPVSVSPPLPWASTPPTV